MQQIHTGPGRSRKRPSKHIPSLSLQEESGFQVELIHTFIEHKAVIHKAVACVLSPSPVPVPSSRPAYLSPVGSMVPEFTLTLSQEAMRNQAGRLKFFLSNWAIISTDRWILDCVQGYRIPLLGFPSQSLVCPAPPVQNPEGVAAWGGIQISPQRYHCSSPGTLWFPHLPLLNLHNTEEERGPEADSESQTPQQLYSEGALQNGSSESPNRHSDARGLDGQIRPAGSLFCGSYSSRFPRSSELCLGGEDSQLHLYAVRPDQCSKNIHQVE